jgi:hypothetical protein
VASNVVFTANTMASIRQEVTELRQLGLSARLSKSIARWTTARTLMLSGFRARTIDRVLLQAEAEAAKSGIRCSFGAVPVQALPH